MNRKKLWFFIFSTIILISFISGCIGGGGQFGAPSTDGTVTIKGVVVAPENDCFTDGCSNPSILEGEPLPNADIILKGENQTLTGKTDCAGNYQISGLSEEGYVLYAIRGKVIVKKAISPVTGDGGEANSHTTAQVILWEVVESAFPGSIPIKDIPFAIPFENIPEEFSNAVKAALADCRDAQNDKEVLRLAKNFALANFGAPCAPCVEPSDDDPNTTPTPTPSSTSTITVQKVVTGDTDPNAPTNWDFTGGLGNFSLSAGGSQSFTVTPGQSYSITETTQPPNWSTSWATSAGGSGTGNAATVTAPADGQTLTITFTNTYTEPPTPTSTITVQKVVTGDTDPNAPTNWDFTGGLGNFSLSAGGSQSFTVTPGQSYSITETTQPPNWSTSWATSAGGSGTGNAATVTAPADGETLTVTFTNTYTSTSCQKETAWGGNTAGGGNAWWFYYDMSIGGTQTIWAGQTKNAGSVTISNGTISIILTGGWELQNVIEPVKIQGYNTIPTDRPNAGQFTTYKGTSLYVENISSYQYYAIHLDVQNCK